MPAPVPLPVRTRLSGPLTITTVGDARSRRIVLDGELDLSSVESLERELRAAEDSAEIEVVVDLRGLEFMDSSGLGTILATSLRCASGSGPRLRLLRGPDAVHRLFELTGVADVLPFESSPPFEVECDNRAGLGPRVMIL
jgi:anti-anti-sigma factor